LDIRRGVFVEALRFFDEPTRHPRQLRRSTATHGDRAMRTRIYVANLPAVPDVTALRAHFGACGPVFDVEIRPERNPGRGRGTAIVEMTNEAGARRALAELNGAMFQGQMLLLEPAPEQGGKRAKVVADDGDQAPGARITMQFREPTNMTYELDCAGDTVVLRFYFPPAAGQWRILAQAGRGADAPSVTSSANSRVQALRGLVSGCHENPDGAAFSRIDWAAVEVAMTKVRAL
jgi:hypothetical protein